MMAWDWGLCHKTKFFIGKGCESIHFWQEENMNTFFETLRRAWKKWKQFRPRVDQHPTYPHSHSAQTIQLMRWHPENPNLLGFVYSCPVSPWIQITFLHPQCHLTTWRTGNISFCLLHNQVLKALQSLIFTPGDSHCFSQALPIAAAQLPSSCFVSSESLLTVSPLLESAVYLFRGGAPTHTLFQVCWWRSYSSNQKKYSDLSSWLAKLKTVLPSF